MLPPKSAVKGGSGKVVRREPGMFEKENVGAQVTLDNVLESKLRGSAVKGSSVRVSLPRHPLPVPAPSWCFP